MNQAPQAEPFQRPKRKKRQDPAILLTVFAFAIAITPEFTFLGIPKVRVTDLLLIPLLASMAPRGGNRSLQAPLLKTLVLTIAWDIIVLVFLAPGQTLRLGLMYIGKRISYYLIFLIGYSSVQSRATWERIIAGLLMATPLLALSVIWSIRSDTTLGEAQRASGVIANQQSSTALFFVILLTLCLGALPVWRSPFARLVGLASLVTGVPAMLATGTRGALVDIAFAVGTLEALRRDLTRSLVALIFSIFLLAGAWNFIPSGLQDRLSETIPHLIQTWENRDRASDFMGGNSAAARLAMAQSCFQHSISTAPLTGSGMASRTLGFVDNFVLTEWTYNGLVGLLLMVTFLIQLGGLIWKAYKSSKEQLEKGIAAGVFASYMAMWLASLHSDSFYLIRPMEAFMLLAGLTVGISRIKGQPAGAPLKRKRGRRTLREILDQP